LRLNLIMSKLGFGQQAVSTNILWNILSVCARERTGHPIDHSVMPENCGNPIKCSVGKLSCRPGFGRVGNLITVRRRHGGISIINRE